MTQLAETNVYTVVLEPRPSIPHCVIADCESAAREKAEAVARRVQRDTGVLTHVISIHHQCKAYF